MTTTRPIYCAFGEHGHPAAYRVKSAHREAVTCAAHLDKAQRWAGRGTTTSQIDGADPGPVQLDLFAATPQEDQ